MEMGQGKGSFGGVLTELIACWVNFHAFVVIIKCGRSFLIHWLRLKLKSNLDLLICYYIHISLLIYYMY